MIVFPNAKINIGLRILRKRSDGYHDLESLFYPLQFTDVLEILPSNAELNDKKTEIYVSGLEVPAGEDNLCSKALSLFRDRHGIPGARIHLHKKIPPGSGLGGGSSDAAFTLLALNKLYKTALSRTRLKKYASELGSDCSFFITNSPSLINGRGNVLEQAPIELRGYFLALVLPGIEVSTSMAYKLVRPSEEGIPVRQMILLPPEQWKGNVMNSFEEPIFRKFPELGKIKDGLDRSGAVYSSMSGSGSAIYGIFDSPPVLVQDLLKYPIHIEEMSLPKPNSFQP
jgi:4-diphosphocytidyl-2-C-methyl-D-erythritol kinase